MIIVITFIDSLATLFDEEDIVHAVYCIIELTDRKQNGFNLSCFITFHDKFDIGHVTQ